MEEVRSIKLRTALTRILVKLVGASGPGYLNIVESLGRPLAARMSQIARSWGNKEAVKWKADVAMIRYLGVNRLGLRMFG